MKTLKVPGMMCNMCVKRITKALTDEGINATVELSTKTVSVAEELVSYYSINTIVDTILCLDGTEVVVGSDTYTLS